MIRTTPPNTQGRTLFLKKSKRFCIVSRISYQKRPTKTNERMKSNSPKSRATLKKASLWGFPPTELSSEDLIPEDSTKK